MTAPPAKPVPSPRQTLSYIRSLFDAYGLEAKSKLGQNFLIDLNLVDLIVRTAELDRSDAVLEVGTGTGSLTARLAEHAGAVVTVEIDTSLAPVAREVIGARPDIERMVVMVQWEIAERLRAVPGTKDYNALSILVQSIADVEVVRKVLPTNFYPRPKVDSAIVMIGP